MTEMKERKKERNKVRKKERKKEREKKERNKERKKISCHQVSTVTSKKGKLSADWSHSIFGNIFKKSFRRKN